MKITSTKTTLADKFIAALGDQEMFPALHNSTIFVQTSGWNVEKYYGKHYLNKTPFPLLVVADKTEGVMFMPATKSKKLSEETFKVFWSNSLSLSERLSKYREQTKVIDNIYNKVISSDLSKEPFEILVQYAEQIKTATWEMNTIAFFSTYFDKEMCSQLLADVKSVINEKRLDIIWEKGVIPTSESFEQRRERYVVESLAGGNNWKELGVKYQYFGANYNKIINPEEVERNLREKFGRLENIEDRTKFLEIKNVEQNKITIEHNEWVKTLSKEEKKLVEYLQIIIELRDVRKDYLAKLLVVIFRIAEKLFKEAGVNTNLIYFYRFDEIIKGKENLLKNKTDLEKRPDGYAVFVNYDGTIETEYGTTDEIKDKVESFFLEQQNEEGNTEIIKGQVGSPGRVQGIVKVVANISTESHKFNDGDILVTGMTRPEFVPLMKKAMAVITDEGGITCHAAIIARELKIPCVIGTKIATQVLKDGDMVEVDAEKGVVKIISN